VSAATAKELTNQMNNEVEKVTQQIEKRKTAEIEALKLARID
jgi:hypothetical protein